MSHSVLFKERLPKKKVQEQDKNVLFEIIQENKTTTSGIMWNYVE